MSGPSGETELIQLNEARKARQRRLACDFDDWPLPVFVSFGMLFLTAVVVLVVATRKLAHGEVLNVERNLTIMNAFLAPDGFNRSYVLLLLTTHFALILGPTDTSI